MNIKRRQWWKQRILRYRKAVHGYALYIVMVALFLCFLPIIAFAFWGKHQYFVILVALTAIFTLLALFYLTFTKKEIIDKAAWFMLILLVPFFGAFLFWFIGISQSRPKIYWDKSKKDGAILKRLAKKYDMHLPQSLQHMKKIAPYSQFTAGNQQQFLTGAAVYEAMLQDILRAKHHIHLEMYIVRYDKTTKVLFDALVKKVQEGVEVRLLLDVFGTIMFSDKRLEQLIDDGLAILFFNQQTHQYLDHAHVNHRKNLVVDGEIAYTGGFNFGDEYVHGYPRKKLKWYDMMARVEGNLVMSIQMMFLMDWAFSLNMNVQRFLEDKSYFPQKIMRISKNEPITQFIADGPDREGSAIKDTLSALIHQGKERIYFTTPYLIPPDDILDDLKLAAASGVDVRIIIPDVPDKKIVYYSTQSYIEGLLKAGVRIYKMTDYFVHVKLYVFDQRTTMYGTANLDMRSFFLNLEENIVQYRDPHLNQQAMLIFNDLLNRSQELQYESWHQRPWYQKSLEKIFNVLNPLF